MEKDNPQSDSTTDFEVIRRYFRSGERAKIIGRSNLFSPIFAKIWEKLGVGDYLLRIHYDAVPRPHCAWSTFAAAATAKILGHNACTVAEFGCAGGAGLRVLEDQARRIGNALDIDIRVIGFDLGDGMPPPVSKKDYPYWFTQGTFPMDVQRLQSQLKTAKLVIGNVAATACVDHDYQNAPLGFMSVDVDTYSGTLAILKMFEVLPSAAFLPRVLIYLDDVCGNWNCTLDTATGERAAIDEFNREHEFIKIGHIRGLQRARALPASWHEKMFCAHIFENPTYSVPIRSALGAGNNMTYGFSKAFKQAEN